MRYWAFFILCIPLLSAIAFEGASLTYQQGLLLVAKSNLDLIARRYEIDKTAAEEITAGLWANPSVFFDSQLNSFGQAWNQTNAGGPAQKDLILSIPIDANGKRRSAVKSAKLATKIAEWKFTIDFRNKLMEYTQNYFTAIFLQKERDVLKEQRDLLERTANGLQTRITNPNLLPLLQTRVRVALDQANIVLQQKEAEYFSQIKTLQTLIGGAEIKKLETTKDSEPKFPAFGLEQLLEKSKNQRPEVKLFSTMKEKFNQDLETEEKKIWDDIVVSFGATNQYKMFARPGDASTPSLPTANSWLASVTIPLPTFDRRQGQLAQVKVNQAQVEAIEKAFFLDLQNSFESSLNRQKTFRTILKIYHEQQLKNSKQVRDAAQRQFGAGATSVLEYLDALGAYQTSVMSYLQNSRGLLLETFMLKFLTGEPFDQ